MTNIVVITGDDGLYLTTVEGDEWEDAEEAAQAVARKLGNHAAVLWVQVLGPELLAQMQTIVNLYVKASAA